MWPSLDPVKKNGATQIQFTDNENERAPPGTHKNDYFFFSDISENRTVE